MHGNQIPAWSMTAFCGEMPFLRLETAQGWVCDLQFFGTPLWRVAGGPCYESLLVPGSQAEGNPQQQEVPVCRNEGVQLAWAWAGPPLQPQAATWLPASLPGLAREGAQSRWGAG